MIVQHFDINLIPGGDVPEVDVSQQDAGSGRLVAHLFAGSEAYEPSGAAVIQGTREDGGTFRHDARIEGSTVTADVTEDMTAAPGRARAQIVVTEGESRTGSGIFFLNVQRGATT